MAIKLWTDQEWEEQKARGRAVRQALRVTVLRRAYRRWLAERSDEDRLRQTEGIRSYVDNKKKERKSRQTNITRVEVDLTTSARRVKIKMAMPQCKDCGTNNVIRAGVATGYQRYRCKACRRTFAGSEFLVVADQPVLTCRHCGGTKCESNGYDRVRNARRGYCLPCGVHFYQGGKSHLDRYHLHLMQRARQLTNDSEISHILFCLAAQDVIAGRGYCWNVVLRLDDALGEYRKYRPSASNYEPEGS